MVKDKPLKVILWSVTLTLGFVLSLAIGGLATSTSVNANAANAYDISSYQGYVNNNQASQLKNEVNFMILKAENGGLYTDPQFNHNASEMSAHNIPYGAYDYSLYANPTQAQSEATALYQRAPQANFYVNDSEENNAGNQLDASTQAWANQIHQLTNKPAILYSDMAFMNNFAPQTRESYDGIWLAAYSNSEPSPNYHYDLWQNSDNTYSPALNQNVDSSVFPDNTTKPLSFWTAGNNTNHATTTTDSDNNVIKPVVHHHRRHQQGNVIKPRKRKSRKANRNQVQPTKKTREKRRKSRRSRKKFRRYAESKRNRKSSVNRSKRSIRYNPHYYRSKRVRLLRVKNRNGINLYTLKGRYFGHVDPGTVLNVYRYLTVYHHRTGYMTKAVGVHYGQYDLFTSRKDLVKWYRK